MALIGRDAILQADDLAVEVVEVPEWGGEVMVRGLTGKERGKFQAMMVTQKGNSTMLNTAALGEVNVWLCLFGICDEAGGRIFTDKDFEALAKKSGTALERIASVIQRLSGLQGDEVEQLAANFTMSQNGGSGSD